MIGTLALSACATAPAEHATPTTTTTRPAELRMTLERPEADARTLVEQVAARCWLDAELQANALIVDKQTGRMVVVGETEELLTARFSAIDAKNTRLSLTGPAIDDTALATRLMTHLRIAEDTGETAC